MRRPAQADPRGPDQLKDAIVRLSDAREIGADMVGCQFQVNFGPSAVNVTGFGTAIRIS